MIAILLSFIWNRLLIIRPFVILIFFILAIIEVLLFIIVANPNLLSILIAEFSLMALCTMIVVSNRNSNVYIYLDMMPNSIGGIQVYANQCAVRLKELGYNPIVIFTNVGKPGNNDLFDNIRKIKIFSRLTYVRYLQQFFYLLPLKIASITASLNIYNSPSSIMFSSRKSKNVLIQHFDDTIYNIDIKNSFLLFLIVKIFGGNIDNVISFPGNNDYKDYFKNSTNYFAIPPIKKITIKNDRSTKNNRYLWLGRVSQEQKNWKLAFEISEKINLKIDIFGNVLKEEKEEFGWFLSRNKNINYNGTYSFNDWDKFAYYKGLIITSNFEGFPVVLLEAVSCGIPVYSTECAKSVVELGKRKIIKLFKTPEDLKLKLAENYQNVKMDFDIGDDVIEKILGEKTCLK